MNMENESSFPRKRESSVVAFFAPGTKSESRWIPAFAGMTSLFLPTVLSILFPLTANAQTTTTRTLDDFSDASQWRVVTSNQVSGAIRQIEGAGGKALTYRVRWTPSGDAYEAASEMLVDGRWLPQFKLLLKKQ